jgi:hypothetical protein
MTEYRIKKVTWGDATAYHPQEKFGWFWFDMYRYGFDTYEHAQEAICNYLKEPFPSVEYLEFDPAKNCK